MNPEPKSPHPWTSERDKFLGMILASYLLDLPALLTAIEGHDDLDNLSSLCEHLVARGALTKWQCEKLRNGQYKGYFLAEFKLLDHISSTYYWVENRTTGRKVKLLIVPNPKWPEGVEYRVVE